MRNTRNGGCANPATLKNAPADQIQVGPLLFARYIEPLGSELAGTHVVKVDGHDAKLCTCGADCDCEIDAEDETKCSCGNDLRTVSLEGSGLYFCNCGGSCTCNYVSDEPGKCACGMELIT